jgi:hypothetical protein
MNEELNKAVEKLLEAITADYYRWTKRSWEASGYDMDGFEAKINEFKDQLEVKKGRKFIKILTDSSVWGFVNLTHDKFKEGDILKAAGYNAPALNKARGNIFDSYSVAWTGPHYIAGYSAGGVRSEGLNRGNSRMVNS